MQIQEKINEGLKRAYDVSISQDDVEAAKAKKLQEIAKTAKIQGFRPGKAPLHIIRQRFGANIESEVLDALVNEGAQKTLKDFSIRPAMLPRVEMAPSPKDGSFVFKMELEVLPEITTPDFSKMSFERHVVEIEEKKIDEMLERIGASSQKTEVVTETRSAVKGDLAVIDFEGSVEGVSRDDMKAKGHKVKLGSHTLIDTFEEQIEGMKVGDEKQITVTFPKDYGAAELAGKESVFKVILQEIREFKAPVMDDAWAKTLGFPSLDKLRERISDDLAKHYADVSRTELKRKLMDDLSLKSVFALPESMVEHEFDSIWKQVQKDKTEGTLDEDDAKKTEDELRKEYRSIAERRVRLGLLLAHVAEENDVTVSQAELRNASFAYARQFKGQEMAVLEKLSKSPRLLDHLRAPLLEDKVIDFIISKISLSEKKVSIDEINALGNEQAA